MNDTPAPDAGSAPSLRAYLGLYAAGFVEREQMIATVAAWPFEAEEGLDEGHPEPTHQDNTPSVLAAARLLGQVTREDVEEIQRRIDGRPDGPADGTKRRP
ncbi:hypothetical protein CW362_06260 [Streptomyces populi]|uniref:Uncharacterized protein n=1 Tax=Streptomyces populi TaxID=2058924 RepID=A0A2I0SVM9_9ACTN|nr:hypothetical protein [Streptomyces populi]PKT73950.1 hypothetical protein CW362_06260 [Streptomyces populi]